jgi:hypothetical protein
MKTPHTLIATGLDEMTVAETLTFAKHLVASQTGNPQFPSPTPPLAQVTADIAAVDAAETQVKSGLHGAAEARNVKLTALVNDIHGLEAYVQSIADAHPTEAASIIQSAGFKVKAVGAHPKQDIEAHMGPGGIAIIRARAAAKKAAYEFQISSDGGKTWVPLPVTTEANTTVAGLVPATTQMFRVRATIGHVTGEWSQTVSLLIH